jgi:hypothetical protein
MRRESYEMEREGRVATTAREGHALICSLESGVEGIEGVEFSTTVSL